MDTVVVYLNSPMISLISKLKESNYKNIHEWD